MNWLALTIMVIWLSAAIGASFTKDADTFFFAFCITVLMGLGYLLTR